MIYHNTKNKICIISNVALSYQAPVFSYKVDFSS